MLRRTLLFGPLALYGAEVLFASRALAWQLLSPEEIESDRTAPHVGSANIPAQAGAPVIDLEEPDIRQPVKSPVNISLKFRANDDASIKPDSFRAYYGWLNLDITKRITDHARLSASGLTAKDADIPPGTYSVTLQVGDTKGRVGVRAFAFKVI
jgi:hypothetical protein